MVMTKSNDVRLKVAGTTGSGKGFEGIVAFAVMMIEYRLSTIFLYPFFSLFAFRFTTEAYPSQPIEGVNVPSVETN